MTTHEATAAAFLRDMRLGEDDEGQPSTVTGEALLRRVASRLLHAEWPTLRFHLPPLSRGPGGSLP
jgi:hypothetical protein